MSLCLRSVSHSEMSRRVFPDFCPGWLYVTTPRVGLHLAEVANMATDIYNVARLDDIYVTGFLRERLRGITLQQLHSKGIHIKISLKVQIEKYQIQGY